MPPDLKSLLIGILIFCLPFGLTFGFWAWLIFNWQVGLIVGIAGFGLMWNMLFGKGCQ